MVIRHNMVVAYRDIDGYFCTGRLIACKPVHAESKREFWTVWIARNEDNSDVETFVVCDGDITTPAWGLPLTLTTIYNEEQSK